MFVAPIQKFANKLDDRKCLNLHVGFVSVSGDLEIGLVLADADDLVLVGGGGRRHRLVAQTNHFRASVR